MQNKLFFSIVIPTLNEESYLPLLLEDLAYQTYTDFEVIHVDGSSEDQTVKKAKSFEKKLNLYTYTTDIRNVSHQRNIGIEKSKGQWIIFMDADNRLPKYFLDGVRYRLAQNPKTDIFTTWLQIDKEKTLNKPIERTLNYSLELGRIAGKEWSFGALIGVKKEILKDTSSQFDKNQKVGEDGIFVKNLVAKGHVFSVFRDPKYTYSVRRFDAEGTIQMARKGALIALNYLQGKDFSENDFGYKMDGGSAYNKHPFLSYYGIQSFVKSATKNQIEQAKKLFKSLTDFDF